MKLIICILLFTSFLGYKKESELTLPYISLAIVDTYEVVSITLSGLFKDLLSGYDSFKETTTAVFSLTEIGTYQKVMNTTGVAQKGTLSPVSYGFSAFSKFKEKNSPYKFRFGFKGNHTSISHSNSYLKDTQEIEGYLNPNGLNLNVFIVTFYKMDAWGLLITTLKKVK